MPFWRSIPMRLIICESIINYKIDAYEGDLVRRQNAAHRAEAPRQIGLFSP